MKIHSLTNDTKSKRKLEIYLQNEKIINKVLVMENICKGIREGITPQIIQ